MQRQGKQGFVDPAVLQAAAAVTASAEAEVRSPFRMYLFGYMAVVLALVTAQGEQALTSRTSAVASPAAETSKKL